MYKPRSLKNALFKTHVFTTLITTLIILVVILVSTQMMIRREHRELSKIASVSIQHAVEEYIDHINHEITRLALLANSDETTSPALKNRVIASFLSNDQTFTAIEFLSLDGRVMEHYPPNDDRLGTDARAMVAKTTSSQVINWSEVLFDQGKHPYVTVSYTLNNCILVAYLNLDEFGSIIYKISHHHGDIFAIADAKGQYVAHSDVNMVNLREKDPYLIDYMSSGQTASQAVTYKSKVVDFVARQLGTTPWFMIYYHDNNEITQDSLKQIIIVLAVSGVMLLVTIGLNQQKINRITNLLDKVIYSTQMISKGQYIAPFSSTAYKEINDLFDSFNHMSQELKHREIQDTKNKEKIQKLNEVLEQEVKLRTADLLSSKEALEESIDELKFMQNTLVQSEKMASLGQLVAGVTHEMMTPIGSTYTLVSLMDKNLEDMAEKFKTASLTKSDLAEFIEDQKEIAETVMRNVYNTKTFVESLKKTSVDHSTMEMRDFDLCATLSDAIVSLKIAVKQANATITLNCNSGILLYNYPGAYTQIILNLVNNILLHAFNDEDGKDRTIQINAHEESEHIVLTVEDNGVGMSQEVVTHIFEPFYTTTRDSGGSGLGLSIVYNLVTSLLGGYISCYSLENFGTTFEMRLPKAIKKA